MYKYRFLLFSCLIFTALAASETILNWDFANSSFPKNMQFVLKGKTAIKEGALYSPEVAHNKSNGFAARKIHPELTPSGAFTFTACFTMQEARSKMHYLMLWDNKGDFYDKKTTLPKDNSGFTIAFSRTEDGKKLVPHAWLGLGNKTVWLKGKAFSFKLGEKYTLTFDYNGTEKAFFALNGKTNSTFTVQPGGSLAPALYRTVIGNRAVGNFYAFDGLIHRITLKSRPAEKLQFQVRGRKVFIRNEKDAALQITVRNLSNEVIGGLKKNESKTLKLPVETALAPGEHTAKLEFAGFTKEFTYRTGPVPHDQLPVVLWDYNDDFRHLQNAGFTHGLKSIAVRVYTNDKTPERLKPYFDELDEMLFTGFRKMDYFNLVHFPSVFTRFPRISKAGKPIIVKKRMNVDAANPEAIRFLTDFARKTAQLFGSHPALDFLDVNSEVRDRTAPSFTTQHKEAFRKHAGFDIPDLIENKTMPYYSIPDFPPDRVISANHPYLTYYRWFWTVGDGWNVLHSKISETYHKEFKHPFKTYFAPAARQPPMTGAGGSTDMVGQWTYANPDPLRLTAAVDELLAVADGRPAMHGVQLICYRSQCAPGTPKNADTPEWVKKHPNAQYITIPPDTLIEAVWSVLSRPVQGLIFHGDGSFFPPPIKGASIYIMTNAKTKEVFTELSNKVIKPLGPALKHIPQEKSPIAILHSFSSSVLAERGTYGWRGWPMDLHLALQWGGLTPRVIYEEHLLREKLKDVKILFMPHCDILTSEICREITDFQLRGGIVVADETVPPAILPQYRIKSYSRYGKDPLQAKEELVSLGKKLKKMLIKHHTPVWTSSSSDLVVHTRGNYVFVINDKRTYGDYIGQWKQMAEKALPVQGKISVRKPAGAVYDPVNRKMVPFKSANGVTELSVDFSGAGGKLFLLLPEKLPVPKLKVSADGLISADTGCKETLPVRLEVRDPQGKITDDTHFAAAVNGKFQYKLQIPKNSVNGKWQISFTVLPSDKTVSVKWNAEQK